MSISLRLNRSCHRHSSFRATATPHQAFHLPVNQSEKPTSKWDFFFLPLCIQAYQCAPGCPCTCVCANVHCTCLCFCAIIQEGKHWLRWQECVCVCLGRWSGGAKAVPAWMNSYKISPSINIHDWFQGHELLQAKVWKIGTAHALWPGMFFFLHPCQHQPFHAVVWIAQQYAS